MFNPISLAALLYTYHRTEVFSKIYNKEFGDVNFNNSSFISFQRNPKSRVVSYCIPLSETYRFFQNKDEQRIRRDMLVVSFLSAFYDSLFDEDYNPDSIAFTGQLFQGNKVMPRTDLEHLVTLSLTKLEDSISRKRTGLYNCLKGGPEILELYRFAISEINKFKQDRDRPVFDFREVLDVMIFDYKRTKNNSLLSKAELENYFQKTFVPVLNLSLIISNSQLRGEDIMEMVTTQGHIYSIRDLETDLSRGIINLPLEELQKSELRISDDINHKKVLNDRHLITWMDKEIKKYHEVLNQFKYKLREEGDKGSRKICVPLIRGMEHYCRKYTKKCMLKDVDLTNG